MTPVTAPRRSALAVVFAALLTTAGCAAPVAQGRGPGAADAGEVSVTGGSLPADPGRVFGRVTALLGANVSPPNTVRVVDDPSDLLGGAVSRSGPPRAWQLLGVRDAGGLNQSERQRLENGLTSGLGTIVLYPGQSPTARSVQWLLAHEFVHYVQFARGRDVTLARSLPSTTDGRFVRRAVMEGIAVYVTDAYVQRYVPGAPPNSALYERVAATLANGSFAQYGNLAYVAGHAYATARLDAPNLTERIYSDPPVSGEQVLHPGADPPAPLTVRLRTGAAHWRGTGRDTLGEPFVRVALQTGVSAQRARTAAAGWGNDTLQYLRPTDGGNTSIAWVLRWDSPEDADQFAAAYRAALDARGTATGNGTWRLDGAAADVRRPGPRTTVVAVGAPPVVRSVAANVTGATVRLTVAPTGGDATRQAVTSAAADSP
ncbi:MAG: hypothetical protein ABEJ08_03530 [Halobacteriaceae archaeon]